MFPGFCFESKKKKKKKRSVNRCLGVSPVNDRVSLFFLLVWIPWYFKFTNLAHSLSVHLNERVCCARSCVCVSQHLGVEMSELIFLQGHATLKEQLQLAGTSCFGRKHCHARRAFLLMLDKQPALSLYFSRQPPWWPIIMTTQIQTLRRKLS